MNINHFVLSGRVTNDLKLQRAPSGTTMVTYTIASKYSRYNAEGVKHDFCDFVPVTTYGEQAERDAKVLRKGSSVAVEGRIESWHDEASGRGGFSFSARIVEYHERAVSGAEHPELRDKGAFPQSMTS